MWTWRKCLPLGFWSQNNEERLLAAYFYHMGKPFYLGREWSPHTDTGFGKVADEQAVEIMTLFSLWAQLCLRPPLSIYLLVCKSELPSFVLSGFEFCHFPLKECHWPVKDPGKSLGLKHSKASWGPGTRNSRHEDPGGLSSWLLCCLSLGCSPSLYQSTSSFSPHLWSAEGSPSSNLLIQNPDS